MDVFALLAFCLSALALTLALRLKQGPQSTAAAATPPSPTGLPFVGHLHLLTDMPHHAFADLARRLGPIFRLQLGRVPTLVVSSAELARDVLKTHDHLFCSRPQLESAQYLSFGCSDVTFSKYGAYWRQARRVCVTELLGQRRVASFEGVRSEEVGRLVEAVSEAAAAVDIGELAFRLANDVLCRVAFGRRFGADGRLAGVMKETQALFAGFSAGDLFPGWGWVSWVSGYRWRLRRNLRDLRGVCDEIIREHRRGGAAGRAEDFVDVLLRVQKSGTLEVPITDDNLKALVLDMFVAGTDTTSATLEWAMAELARHPAAMEKAREEVRGRAAGRVEEAHLQRMQYLRCVVKETLRLHPPAPLLVPRESMARCSLGGYDIPAGTRLLINAYAVGRDPGAWAEPLEFRPERFAAAEGRSDEFRFLAFGGGRRGCPGSSFGLATVELALASLLFHFDWAVPGGRRGEEVEMEEVFGLASRKKNPLLLVPTISATS